MLRQFLDKWNDYSNFSLSSCNINVSKIFPSVPLVQSIRVLSDGPFLNLNWLENCVKHNIYYMANWLKRSIMIGSLSDLNFAIRVLSDGPFLKLNWLTNCVKCLCEYTTDYTTYIGLRTRTLNEELTCVGHAVPILFVCWRTRDYARDYTRDRTDRAIKYRITVKFYVYS